MKKQFIESAQTSSNVDEMDVENPLVLAVLRILQWKTTLYSILLVAEHTLTTLLIVTFRL